MNTPLDLIVQTLRHAVDNVELIYLFGSQINGYAKASSDWDIAFKARSKLPPLQRWRIQEDLANALQREVDLIDLLDASPVMQLQVIETGRLLFGETKHADQFGMQVYSSYSDWQSRRREIMQSFVEQVKLLGD